ncbi:AarF/ABC1/UbiB kinase family protein [Spirulina subsalsa FACHB-351]|uniref:AarF/ABC1/UbiB kinase family protein n=1 Tax=Spirulina subsalsa FACHB-351 TaxID=234711 RepID=A0ABT3L3H1_9CYAN|nr:AarF/ABC1/UbiB kinase family protein [Spirulina subsalsa]MCW6035530.1 AarF/ABC1/UbiB kinase family protein [Spirulina subsalsa FACHB-351]
MPQPTPYSSSTVLEQRFEPDEEFTRPEKIRTVLDTDTLSASEIGHYNPDLIIAYYRRHPLQVIGRLIAILLPLVSFSFKIWLDKTQGKVAKNQRKRAVKLREILTRLGPTYIKVGQALSTRPDLVPPLYLEELAYLQDQLPPFSNDIAYRFIEEELGDHPREIYAELSPNPVAAASLGQVYKGRLKTGEIVAVKVQRPDLIRRITLDVYIMRSLAAWAQKNIKRLRSDLIAITDEFAARIFEEMDYAQEGRNAELFAELYGYIPEIYIPRIYWEYTGRRVLTMEWIEGTKLTNLEAVQAKGIDATYLVEVGVSCSLRQLLEHGFFHADPHPGNLLATPDGKLAYLDFGMMSQIKPYQRYGLIEAVVHLVNRDFDSLAQDYIKLEFLTPDTDLTPIIPALSNVFGNALGASVAELNFKSITDQMSEMMYEFPFRVPAYYALIIRSLVTLEGIAIGIDPDFKVLSKAYPYIAKRLLTDPSPELRASLRDLLFRDGNFRWNRLENLLRNARNSQDYDFDKVLNQALDFLFSPRGEFIRERLVDEIVKAIDIYGRRTLFNFSSAVRQQVGMKAETMPSELEASAKADSLQHLQNILQMLNETPGFDVMRLVPLIPELITKPETQIMGQKIASGLAQKMAARLIRNLLLEAEANNNKKQEGKQGIPFPFTPPRLPLPPQAAMR